MKLYIDDIREAPEGWTLVRTISEAVNFIARYFNEIKEISIDHDISFEVRVNGIYRPFPSPDSFEAVAHFIGLSWRDALYTTPKITIHSANPDGCSAIKSILRYYGIDSTIEMMGEAHRQK